MSQKELIVSLLKEHGVLKQLDGIIPKDSVDEINKQLDKTSIKDVKITIYLKDGYISIIEMSLDDICEQYKEKNEKEKGEVIIR